MERIVSEVATKLKTTDFDVWRLAMKWYLGKGFTHTELGKRYRSWLRGGHAPVWVIDFCINVMTDKIVVSFKDCQPKLLYPGEGTGGLQ